MISIPHNLVLLALSLAVLATPALAKNAGGLTFRLSLHPDVQTVTEDVDDTEEETEGGVTATSASETETTGTMSESLLNLGVGYTFGFGLHLGASFWQSTSTLDMTMTSTDPDDPDSGAEFKSKSKTTATAIGPTVGFMHDNGLGVFLTPFASVATKSEDSSEVSISGWSSSDDPEPEVTDDSKTSGFRLDFVYHIRLGAFAIGPELTYMSTTTKIDVTTTETDTSLVTGDVTSTTTRQTGTSRYSRIVPMIGMAVIL